MPWNLIHMTFHALPGKALLLLFIFGFLMFEATAFDDKCLSYYSFENESDTPDEKSNFSNNGGWRFIGHRLRAIFKIRCLLFSNENVS